MPASRRPNILIIMSDQHSKHVLGCYGDPVIQTPHLDGLASQGTRMTDAYCASPICVASRMSFMTGRLPSRTQVWNNRAVLSSSIPTWAHALGAAGYETALLGRMHFVGTDHRHGFERRPLGEWTARPPGVPEQGGPRYQYMPSSTAWASRTSLDYAGKGPSFYQWFDNIVAERTCEYLKTKSSDQDRPFAAVAGFHLPHCPFVGRKDLFEHYYDKVTIPDQSGPVPESVQLLKEAAGVSESVDEHRVRVTRAAYYAMVHQLDENVGRVLSALEDNGLADNTIVIYCSDHGEMAGEHGLWWKLCFYEGSVGVPMMIRWPGVLRNDDLMTHPCSLMDIAPTLARLAGAPEMDTDGHDLHPWLGLSYPDDQACGWDVEHGVVKYAVCPRDVLSEFVDERGRRIKWATRMIRTANHKLWLTTLTDGSELPAVLFDLHCDPHETSNLISHPEYQDVATDLLSTLRCPTDECAPWDARQAMRVADQQLRDLQLLEQWGKQVAGPIEETLAFPGAELEADVELL